MPFGIWCGGCNSMIAKGVSRRADFDFEVKMMIVGKMIEL